MYTPSPWFSLCLCGYRVYFHANFINVISTKGKSKLAVVFFFLLRLGLKLLDCGQLLYVRLVEGFFGGPVQQDFFLMLLPEFFGIPSLAIGHIDFAGLGVVDDMGAAMYCRFANRNSASTIRLSHP